MAKAARLYSIFMLLIFVGSFIADLGRVASLGPASMLGAFMVPVLIGIPTVPALMAIGAERPRTEAFAIVANNIYLFILAAAAVGFGFSFVTKPNPNFFAWLMVGAIVALCFVLNIIALRRQRTARVAESI